MILMDTIRRGELPDGVAVLQVMPCNETVAPAGQRIFSLWQGPDVDAVSSAVESTIGDHCTSTLFPVMEDHSHGISKERLDEKLERVARNTGRKIRALDDKLGVSESVTAATAVTVAVTTEAAKTAWEGTKNAWEKAAPLREKVENNEVVQQGVAQVKEGWRSLVSWVNPGAGAAGRPVNGPAETVNVGPPANAAGDLIPTSENAQGAPAPTEDEAKPAELSA